MKRPDTCLTYGETGTGKTTQIGQVAQWLFKRTGKTTRLISADSSWGPLTDAPNLIFSEENPEGIIEVLDIQNLHEEDNPFTVLSLLSDGAWMTIKNGRRYMTPPSPKGKPLKDSRGRIVGLEAIEGLTTIAELLRQDHVHHARKLSEGLAYSFKTRAKVVNPLTEKVEDYEETFGQTAQSHYGNVQDVVLGELVPRFSVLPVDMVWWTGHEGRGEDDGKTGSGKNSVLGPATVGSAAIGRTAKKFADTFHLVREIARIGNNRTVLYKAYYQDHPDDVMISMNWRAKLSLPLSRTKELEREFPGGFIPLTEKAGMEKYLDFKYKNESLQEGRTSK